MKSIFILGFLILISTSIFAQRKKKRITTKRVLSHILHPQRDKAEIKSTSFYQNRLDDPEAVYFTPEKYQFKADGTEDVSDALQAAINEVKSQHNFGILFIPEGVYRISKTIYVPRAVRLIGYGKTRPLIVLSKDSPGYQTADSTDKGQAKYMFWFNDNIVRPGQPVGDAGASTFYSAFSNIDLKIEDGNPVAVALRTHYAQHSFVSHSDIHIGNGKAGMFDVGNEMEDVRFFEGDYGIYTTKTSPGWQFMMVDTYFEGQRKAAIRTRETGLTIVRLRVKDVPSVIDIEEDYNERLFMENCQFDNISGPAINISIGNNATNQISLRNIDCRKVPVFVNFRQDNKKVTWAGAVYKVKNFIHGLQIDSLNSAPVMGTIQDIQALTALPEPAKKDIPDFPSIDTWVNLKSLGATGDGTTDDTKAIQDAVDKYPNIYVPQGWYRVSQTIKLKPNTMLLGLSPIATQFILENNTPAFGGFGPPEALLETAKGGTNIVSGIGLSTGADNPRAVACKWTAGPDSYMNDVKFIGGHGGMDRIWKQPPPAPPAARQNRAPGNGNGMDPSWDTQYWSLWITDGGGGTFKNIWSANTYAATGAYISNTSTSGRIYAMSIEHHVRNEIRFNQVSNWKIYALQLEEESREGTECQPVELVNSHDMVFGNLYMFRVIRIIKPYPYSIRNWGSSNIEFLNVHNYSQTKYTTSLPFYDINTGLSVKPWDFNRLYLGKPAVLPAISLPDQMQKLGTGFELAEGICKDSKGNVYFCDSRLRRIYKWSADTRMLTLLADYPWEPLSLSCDKNDNLLVVFKYIPKPGYLVNGKPEVFVSPPDAAGTSFSGYGNSGFGIMAYSVDPSNPDESIRLLTRAKMGTVKNVYKVLYPVHRRRDSHDFSKVIMYRPEECYIAPDRQTIIPVVFDLTRGAGLAEGFPGKPMYVSDEYMKRTFRLTISPEGYVTGYSPFTDKGEWGITVDDEGKVYIADGDIYIFSPEGKQLRAIEVPERPTTLVVTGTGANKTLFTTGTTSLYSRKTE